MSLRNFIAGAVCSSPLGFSVCHLSLRFAPIRASRKKEGENALMKKKSLLLLLIEYIKSENNSEDAVLFTQGQPDTEHLAARHQPGERTTTEPDCSLSLALKCFITASQPWSTGAEKCRWGSMWGQPRSSSRGGIVHLMRACTRVCSCLLVPGCLFSL